MNVKSRLLSLAIGAAIICSPLSALAVTTTAAAGGNAAVTSAVSSSPNNAAIIAMLQQLIQLLTQELNALLAAQKTPVTPVTPVATTTPAAQAPTVTLSASPASIASGQSATLSWVSTNATSCTGTGFTASGTSGSVSVSPSATANYSLSCTGTGGTKSASVSVTVAAATAAAPTATLSVSPSSITSGQSATLSWSSTNATSCTGTGFTASGTSGSVSVSPTANTTYSISCAGSGGSVSKSAGVTVSAPAQTPTPEPVSSGSLQVYPGCAVPKTTYGHVWYIDPVNGTSTGDGSQAHPWSSLQAVTSVVAGYSSPLLATVPYWHRGTSGWVWDPNANAPIKPGDEILLMNGNYGAFNIGVSGMEIANSDFVTIAPAPGQTPIIGSVHVFNSTDWYFKGLKVQSLRSAVSDPSGYLFGINDGGTAYPTHDIILDGVDISNADDTNSWAQADWALKGTGGWYDRGTPLAGSFDSAMT